MVFSLRGPPLRSLSRQPQRPSQDQAAAPSAARSRPDRVHGPRPLSPNRGGLTAPSARGCFGSRFYCPF